MLMISPAGVKKVACCNAIGMQHATLTKNHATLSTTDNTTASLKALADAALMRNTQRNSCATDQLKPMQLRHEKARKNTVKVAQSCIENQQSANDKILVDYPDDRHHCHECRNLINGRCITQRFRPLDDIPRRCADYVVRVRS